MSNYSLLTGMETDNVMVFHKSRRQTHGCDADAGSNVLEYCLENIDNLDLCTFDGTRFCLGEKAKMWRKGKAKPEWKLGYFRDLHLVNNIFFPEVLVFRCPCRSHKGLGQMCSVPIVAIDFVKYHFEHDPKYKDLRNLINIKKSTILEQQGRWLYCPFKTCPKAETGFEIKVGQLEVACSLCYHRICILCKKSHEGYKCEQYKKLISETVNKSAEDIEYLKKCRLCPVCMWTVEKKDGCDHIKCRCGAHFCWVCGEELKGTIYGEHIVAQDYGWVCRKLIGTSLEKLESDHEKQMEYMLLG